jgi:hypothetical protein
MSVKSNLRNREDGEGLETGSRACLTPVTSPVQR